MPSQRVMWMPILLHSVVSTITRYGVAVAMARRLHCFSFAANCWRNLASFGLTTYTQ